MTTKDKERIRRGGFIFTPTTAKKTFDCCLCSAVIMPDMVYLKVEKGGGGLSWAIRPDRIHFTEIHIQEYIDRYGFLKGGD